MANRIIRPLADWAVRYKADIARFGLPIVALETFNWCYDHLFFGFSLSVWGPVWGGVIPVAGAFLLNVLLFWLYDRMQVDWLKAKYASELAATENKTRFQRLVTWNRQDLHSWKERAGWVLVFIALTAVIDPVILAIYYRESYFKGVSRRDWLVLLAATASACSIWLLLWEPGIWMAKTIYRVLYSFF